MKRQHVRVGLFSALCIGALACGGTQSSAPPDQLGNQLQGNGQGPDVKPAVVINTVEEAHRLLPPSASVYVGIDFGKLTDAPVLERYKKMMVDQMPAEVAAFQAECGIDVMRDFDWLLAAMAAQGDQSVIMLKGNFTQTKVESCVDTLNAKAGSTATITGEGNIRTYEIDGEKMYVSWPTDAILIISDDKGRTLLDEAVGRVHETATDASVASELALVDTGAAIWMSAQVTPAMTSGMPVEDVSAMRMSVEADSTLDIVFAADFLSSGKAEAMHQQAMMGLGMLKGQPMAKPFLPIIEKIKIAQTDRVVSGNLNLTAADLSTIETTLTTMGAMP